MSRDDGPAWRVIPVSGSLLDHEWRLTHVERGDEWLKVAEKVITGNLMPGEMVPEGAAIVAGNMALIATAHYAAANVRARPQ